ncbi:MAG: SIS domain-containing protein [Alphaproteobacteria bacterium]|jgi:glucosamine--fructose-6-phosphate aminotransferase (isomerizing)|nr:SIS domain-containing protein [Alphaproteobacteria bacterium]
MSMLDEAHAIPAVTETALHRGQEAIARAAGRLQEADPTVLVTVARGSSDNAGEVIGRLAAARLGWLPLSLPPSLITMDEARLRWDRSAVLAISQSGRSPDLIAPVAAARAGGAPTLALVNAVDSPLAEAADLVLPIDAGAEHAVAATKSYVLTLVQALRLMAAMDGDRVLADGLSRLPAALEQALVADWSAGLEPLASARSLFVVGRGPALGAARELALKMKELCGLHAEAISGAEIMHGPKALIGPDDPVLVLAPDDASRRLVEECVGVLSTLSRSVIVVGRPVPGAAMALPVPDAPVADLATLVVSTASYPFVAALARARGHDPDNPRHLAKVTETR